MFQPGIGRRKFWRHSNVEVGGILIAGHCVLSIASFGFGLLLIGTIRSVVSSSFESRQNPFSAETNVPKLIGKILLSIGGIFFSLGMILLFIITRNAKTKVTSLQGTTAMFISGTTVQGPNYATPQPYTDSAQVIFAYPPTGEAWPYPTQPNAQFQAYYSNCGQTYPQAPGQEKTYPVMPGQDSGQSHPPVAWQGQPYPQGPGQSPPPIAWQVQSYPHGQGQNPSPVVWQGQPHPQGPEESSSSAARQDQPYSSIGPAYLFPVGGQPYLSASGNSDKNTDPTNLPYNPGHTYQITPSGYPGNGNPPSDAPPPYSSTNVFKL